ncbi:hypothetical protein [Gracilibacillus sp. Marseille-QA3620]
MKKLPVHNDFYTWSISHKNSFKPVDISNTTFHNKKKYYPNVNGGLVTLTEDHSIEKRAGFTG